MLSMGNFANLMKYSRVATVNLHRDMVVHHEMVVHQQQIDVPAAYAGQRVDRTAAELFDSFSRSQLNRWIREGALTVDGQAVKPKSKLFGGECLKLDATLDPAENWNEPQAVEFDVVFEDADLLVIDKPAGVVVHPGAGNRDGTLVNGLLDHRPDLAALPRAGIVHRIDMNTSGLLVVSASARAHKALTAAIAAHVVTRRYCAVAEGRMVAGATIDRPIGRDRRVRTRQQVREDGRAAVTEVRVEERFRAHTLVAAELQTGRTHQIRVHMASIGHPLVGDIRYGARRRVPRAPHPEVLITVQGFPRHALHAAELRFQHPTTGKDLSFTAPLPRDMTELIGVLRQDKAAHAELD